MTFFRVAGELPANRDSDGKQRVAMPIRPTFRSEPAHRGHVQQSHGKAQEEKNFAPF